jgi:hypothetical protein
MKFAAVDGDGDFEVGQALASFKDDLGKVAEDLTRLETQLRLLQERAGGGRPVSPRGMAAGRGARVKPASTPPLIFDCRYDENGAHAQQQMRFYLSMEKESFRPRSSNRQSSLPTDYEEKRRLQNRHSVGPFMEPRSALDDMELPAKSAKGEL